MLSDPGIATPNVTTLAYTYDANKNKTAETLTGVMQPYGFSTTTYDNENRLTAWNRTDGNKNDSWALSLAGDWNSFTENGTTQNRTHSAVHSLSTVDNTTLVHDLKGNLTTNSNGNTYAWDFDNRMKSAVVSGNTHGYAYDALGRRVAKTASDGTNTVTTVFVSDGQQEIAEYVGGTAAASPSRRFVYADYVDEPLAMVSGGNTYFYHQNNLYSTAALTDLAGNVVERYAYNAYGKPVICSGAGDVLTASSVGNPWLFTGRRLDSETGLQYSRARYYSFDLGRWLGRDPIGYGGGLNLYGYVGDEPLDKTDPSGLAVAELAVVGGTVAAGTAAVVGAPVEGYVATLVASYYLGQHVTGPATGAIVRRLHDDPEVRKPIELRKENEQTVAEKLPPVIPPKRADDDDRSCDGPKWTGWEKCDRYNYHSLEAAKKHFSRIYNEQAFAPKKKGDPADSCGTGGGRHYNIRTPCKGFVGSVLCCNCCLYGKAVTRCKTQ